jgi:anti-sigma factor RsiW
MSAGYLTCEELVELVTDYLEGALSPTDRMRFEEHIIACASCQAHLEQMRVTIETVGRLSTDSLTPEAEQDLLHAFRDWKGQ